MKKIFWLSFFILFWSCFSVCFVLADDDYHTLKTSVSFCNEEDVLEPIRSLNLGDVLKNQNEEICIKVKNLESVEIYVELSFVDAIKDLNGSDYILCRNDNAPKDGFGKYTSWWEFVRGNNWGWNAYGWYKKVEPVISFSLAPGEEIIERASVNFANNFCGGYTYGCLISKTAEVLNSDETLQVLLRKGNPIRAILERSNSANCSGDGSEPDNNPNNNPNNNLNNNPNNNGNNGSSSGGGGSWWFGGGLWPNTTKVVGLKNSNKEVTIYSVIDMGKTNGVFTQPVRHETYRKDMAVFIEKGTKVSKCCLNSYYEQIKPVFKINKRKAQYIPDGKIVYPYLYQYWELCFHLDKPAIFKMKVPNSLAKLDLDEKEKIEIVSLNLNTAKWEKKWLLSEMDEDQMMSFMIDSSTMFAFQYAGSEAEYKESIVAKKEEIVNGLDDFVFRDIPEHWAQNYVMNLYWAGVVDGINNGDMFWPDLSLTRIELLKMVLRARGDVVPELVEADKKSFHRMFEDSKEDWTFDQWWAKYLYYGFKNKIVWWYGDGYFRPEKAVTRVEAFQMISLSLGLNVDLKYRGVNVDLSFTDIIKDEWYIPYLGAMTKSGLVNGYGDGTVAPGRDITRAEAAKLISIIIQQKLLVLK